MRPVIILAAIGLFIWLGIGGIAALARTTLNQRRPLGTPELISMSFVDSRTGWAVAANCSAQSAASPSSACESEIYATEDGGQNWAASSRVFLAPRALVFFDAHSGWLIGSIGQRCGTNLCQNVVLTSEDSGKTWNRVSTVSAELTDVAATSKYDFWAVGRACPPARACVGALTQTISGGQLWDSHDLPIVSADLRTGRVNSRVGWVTSADASAGREPLAVTRDGGATWTTIASPCTGHAALADFASESSGWLVCSTGQNDDGPLTVSRTTDGGATWKAFGSIVEGVRPDAASTPTTLVAESGRGPSSTPFLARSLGTSPSGDAWVALASGQLVRTTSAGTQSVALTTGETLKEVLFADSQHGWVLGSRSIWSTADGGQTWIKSVVVSGTSGK